MSLTTELNEFKENFTNNAPQEAQNVMKAAQLELQESVTGKDAKKTGDVFSNFTLKNQKNETINSKDLFGDNDYLIVNFYRGGWCPYCNIELKALKDNLTTFKRLNADLVAITPESPDNSLTTAQKNEVPFNILTDNKSVLATELGLAFELPLALRPLYDQFGLDVQKHNGQGVFTLPIPATYVIDKDMNILLDFIDIDYTKRLDPSDIISLLEKKQ